MRSFLTLGCISLVTVAAFVACGDDSNGPTGTAGTAGTAGAGGGAGAAGAGGSAGMAGSSAGAGGSAGAPVVLTPPAANCTACVQVTVPIPATALDTTNGRSQAQANFVAAATAVPYDLTGVTSITWRIQALTTGANYYVSPFLQNSPPESDATYPGSFAAQTALTATAFPPGQWMDVTIPVPGAAGGADAGVDGGADAGLADAGTVVDAGAADGGAAALLTAYDKSKTRIIGIAVGGLAAAAGEQVSIEIQSVTVNGTSNFTTKTFEGGVNGLALNTGYQFPPGSTLTAK